MVLRRENGGRASRIELYRNEDQSVDPLKIINLSHNVSHVKEVRGCGRVKGRVMGGQRS